MITKHKDQVGPQTYSSNNTLVNMNYPTIHANMQETIFYLPSCKKFLLALIFGSPNTTQTGLENLGCYSSSPLKQNLVPRFLSVVARGAETNLELGLNGCSSNPLVIL
jgi:hypothetical protein